MADDIIRPKPPSKEFLEKTKKLLQKRLDEGLKWVQAKQPAWDKYREMYHNQIRNRDHSWEANLVIPKPYYIVQTITPQILSAVFNMADFITIKHPQLPDAQLIRLGRWFAWFLLRRMNFYMRAVELFTDTPIVGTGLLKMYMSNGSASVDFLKIEDFVPDPRAKKPGDVDSMAFCFNKLQREFGELERATTIRMADVEMDIPVMDPETGQMSDTLQGVVVPQLQRQGMYFNLKEVWENHVKKTEGEGTTVSDHEDEMQVDIPNLDLTEHWGEIETTFGVYDVDKKTYSPGKYEEYVVTSVMNGDEIETIIRCEPSEFYYNDKVEQKRKYLKPFVASIYSANPGVFYGSGAIEPVESLITEMKEHHDLYLDEHKRSVMTILSVLERSGLTPRDLEFAPYAHWVMRNHEDVKPVVFPEVNLQAFMAVHGLIDREIDRTAGASTMMQGIPTTKRQTGQETQMLMAESARRFSTFIHMADHLTLRPLALKTMILMRNMPAIIGGEIFNTPDSQIAISSKDLLDDLEFVFAATGIEPEYSKYAKQEVLPKILRELAGIMQTGAGQWQFNLPEIMKEINELYNFSRVENFVMPVQQMIPLDLLQASAMGDPRLQQAVQALLQNAQALSQAQQEMGKTQGGAPPQAAAGRRPGPGPGPRQGPPPGPQMIAPGQQRPMPGQGA